jgi:hypothetical protein
MHLESLTRIHAPDHPNNDVKVVSTVRNEMLILPHFLEHYRKLGIKYFVFIDNDSQDGTREYLMSQPDCGVWWSPDSFSEARNSTSWVNELIRQGRLAGWCLRVDADELFVFKGMESHTVNEYARDLRTRGYDCVCGMMLDMYPAGNFLSAQMDPATDPLSLLCWFDQEYTVACPKGCAADEIPRNGLRITGGPRQRMLHGREEVVGRRKMAVSQGLRPLLRRLWKRVAPAVPQAMMPLAARFAPLGPPALHKVPLAWVDGRFEYLSNHTNTSHRPYGQLACLLHLKFSSRLEAQIKMLAEDKDHNRRGLRHLQIQEVAETNSGGTSLLYPGSRMFHGIEDVEAIGLLGMDLTPLWKGDVDAIATMAAH